MKTYTTWAMLPSLCTLYGEKINGEGFDWLSEFQGKQSNIREIYLANSAVTAKHLDGLLSHIPQPQTFAC